MKKEVLYRVVRILFVFAFLFLAIFLRNNYLHSYNQNIDAYKSLMNSLQISDVTDKNINQNLTTSEKLIYDLKITNSSNSSKKFSLSLNNNEDNAIDYRYVNYEVVCDDEVLNSGRLTDDVLYDGFILKNTTNVYQIKFWLASDIDESFNNKKFSASISVM